MKRTNIYLDEMQTAALDRLAAHEGVSRARIIRRLLGRSLAASVDDVACDLAAIEASFGAGTDVDAVPRGAGTRAEHPGCHVAA